VDWPEVPNPDDPNFPYSRKDVPYNQFAPHRLKAEMRRRAKEEDEAKLLSGLEEGSPEWIEARLILESKHNSKALYRIRSLEILARAKKMFVDQIEVRGGMTKEQQQAAAQEAVANYLAKAGKPLLVEAQILADD